MAASTISAQDFDGIFAGYSYRRSEEAIEFILLPFPSLVPAIS
jgi:hypothetical protein